MSAPRKYDQEFRDRAVRMYREDRHAGGGTRGGSGRASESEEIRALSKRVAELDRANGILKTSAAFFAQAELDRRLK